MNQRTRTLRSQVAFLAFLTLGLPAIHPSGHMVLAHSVHRVGTTPIIYDYENTAANLASNGVTLQDINRPWHLVKVSLVGGSGSGSLAILPNGTWQAQFCVTNAGFASYDVEWQVPSTTLPNTMFVNNGTAAARVQLTFTDRPFGDAPDISSYACLFFSVATGGAGGPTAYTAANYQVAPAHPVGYLALTSAGNAQITPPPAGGAQQTIEAQLDTITDLQARVVPAALLEDAQSHTFNWTASASATVKLWVFYKPRVALRTK